MDISFVGSKGNADVREDCPKLLKLVSVIVENEHD